MHEQSVTDYARVFGPGHSETVTARSNLAYAYQLAGGYAGPCPCTGKYWPTVNGSTAPATTTPN